MAAAISEKHKNGIRQTGQEGRGPATLFQKRLDEEQFFFVLFIQHKNIRQMKKARGFFLLTMLASRL